jgi:hypothetical protein
MTHPAIDHTVFAQIAQLMGIDDSKTDQTAQSDQHPENAGEFGALFGLELTSHHRKLTSGTAQQTDSTRLCADPPSSRAHRTTATRPAP